MSEALSISLGNSLVMSVAEHADHNTGIITYTVKGRRLSGVGDRVSSLRERQCNDTIANTTHIRQL
jgi:hypothetical protein